MRRDTDPTDAADPPAAQTTVATVDDRVFRELVDHSAVGQVVHHRWRLLYANTEAARIFRFDDPAELLATRSILARIAPADLDRVAGYGRERMAGRPAPDRYEFQGLTRDGESFWVSVVARMVRWGDRDAVHMIFRDITQTKAAEAVLRRQSHILDHIHDAVIVTDLQGEVTSWNRGAERMYGYRADEIVGRNLTALYPDPENDEELLLSGVIRPLKEKGYHETVSTRRRKSGELFQVHLSLSLLRDHDGNPSGMVGTSIDITESVRAREELQRRERLLRTVIDAIPFPVYAKDLEGRYTLSNRAMGEYFQVPPESLIGKQLHDVTTRPTPEQIERILAVDRAVMSTGRPADDPEIEADGPNGRTIRHHQLYPLFDELGQISGLVGISEDITERTLAVRELLRHRDRLEELVQERTRELAARNAELSDALRTLSQAQSQLVQSEKLSSLGSIVAAVAHELNTPIGSSLTVASTLAAHTDEFRKQVEAGLRRSVLHRYMDESAEGWALVQRNLERAAELVHSFKEVAVDRTSSLRREFELGTVIDEIVTTITPVLKRTPHRIQVDVPQPLHMDGYPGPLGQVLSNLIDNALKHAFGGERPGRIEVKAFAGEPGWARVEVSDDGVGIAPDALGKVFDPFFTTRLGRGGSGLGLHVAYNLMTGLLGGRIDVRSEPGRGTVFTLELPLRAPEQEPAAPEGAGD